MYYLVLLIIAKERKITIKKDTQISMKISSELRQKVQEYADSHKWTLSQAINIILEEFLREQPK